MTIRKRLYLSNILMIVVPVCIALLIATGCIGGMWAVVKSHGGLMVDDSEDFYQFSTGIAEMVEQALGPDGAEQEQLGELASLLDRNSVALEITQDGVPVYQYGSENAADGVLLTAAETLGDDARLSNGERSLFMHTVRREGTEYRSWRARRRSPA